MLGHTPKLDAALGTGKVGVEHADVMTGVVCRLDDEHREQLFAQDTEITELAASASPEQFRRKLNQLADSLTNDDGLDRAAKQNEAATLSIRVDHDTGMHHLFAKLSPEQGNRLRRSLDAEINAMSNQPEWIGKRRDPMLHDALHRSLHACQVQLRAIVML